MYENWQKLRYSTDFKLERFSWEDSNCSSEKDIPTYEDMFSDTYLLFGMHA